MLMNSATYTVLFLFATAFIDNKYYVYGGISKTSQPLRELFYLDCSVPFDTSYLL